MKLAEGHVTEFVVQIDNDNQFIAFISERDQWEKKNDGNKCNYLFGFSYGRHSGSNLSISEHIKKKKKIVFDVPAEAFPEQLYVYVIFGFLFRPLLKGCKKALKFNFYLGTKLGHWWSRRKDLVYTLSTANGEQKIWHDRFCSHTFFCLKKLWIKISEFFSIIVETFPTVDEPDTWFLVTWNQDESDQEITITMETYG